MESMQMERPDYSALARILEDTNKEGGFTASVLARDDGFLIASAVAPTTHPDVVAAMSGYVADTVERMRNELGLGDLKDISVRCSAGKAVFRKIASQGKQALILAAIMPRKVRYHARAIGKASTMIRKVLGYKT
jgi:predicted regulator of Ras-like GTPase activity (Roadblock/LC7/MglB family)